MFKWFRKKEYCPHCEARKQAKRLADLLERLDKVDIKINKPVVWRKP